MSDRPNISSVIPSTYVRGIQPGVNSYLYIHPPNVDWPRITADGRSLLPEHLSEMKVGDVVVLWVPSRPATANNTVTQLTPMRFHKDYERVNPDNPEFFVDTRHIMPLVKGTGGGPITPLVVTHDGESTRAGFLLGDNLLHDAADVLSNATHALSASDPLVMSAGTWVQQPTDEPTHDGESTPTGFLLGDTVPDFRSEIATLEAKVSSLTETVTRVQRDHQNDMVVVGEEFWEEAEGRGWCDDAERVIDRINQRTTVRIGYRPRSYDVTFSISGSTTLTLEDCGLRQDVEVSFSYSHMVRVNNVEGDPSDVDFTEHFSSREAMEVLSELSDGSAVDMSLDAESDVDDEDELLNAVVASMSHHDVSVEEEEYERVDA